MVGIQTLAYLWDTYIPSSESQTGLPHCTVPQCESPRYNAISPTQSQHPPLMVEVHLHHGTPQSHLLLGSLKYGSSGSSSAISHAIYLIHGKLEYLCTTKFGEGSPQRTYAEFLNVGVLRLQVILLKTPFTWLWAEVSTPSCCHIANTVPRLTMKILSPLSNLFKWAEKAVIGW